MFKTLLVPMLGESCDQFVLDTAWRLACGFDSHLDCVHVRPNALEMAIRLSTMDAAIAAPVTAELWRGLDEEAAVRAKSARACFEDVCAGRGIVQIASPPHTTGVSATYHEAEGNFLRALVSSARTHDLVVLGRCEPVLDAGALGDVLVSSGRPMLLVPKEGPQALFGTVAIAWKETAEAARTLALAMPILMKAGRIVVLAAAEGGQDMDEVQVSAARAAEYLRWHGLAVETQCISTAGSAVRSVTDAAGDIGAGMLVMGGYGHGRLREFVFGGFTSSVLEAAQLPIFMAH